MKYVYTLRVENHNKGEILGGYQGIYESSETHR